MHRNTKIFQVNSSVVRVIDQCVYDVFTNLYPINKADDDFKVLLKHTMQCAVRCWFSGDRVVY
jgi:hypothetical protein